MLGATTRIEAADEGGVLGFYAGVMRALLDRGVPFVVGGGFAFSHFTGIRRPTKDLDLFVRPQDAEWALGALDAAGFATELVAPHWLGKVRADALFVDVVFSSGNGVAVVDEEWFQHAEPAELMGMQVLLSPVEEMIWSKAYVLERERYDGADVAHLLLARGARIDWERLFRRFDGHWHVLFSHLLLFHFVYPSHRSIVPRWVMRGLLGRLQAELEGGAPDRAVCQGTLLSARQFLVDVEEWGFEDARLGAGVQMTAADVAQLTRDIREEETRVRSGVTPGGHR